MTKTSGISNKLLTTALTTVVVYVLVRLLGLDVSPDLKAAISLGIGAVVAAFGPADVTLTTSVRDEE